MEKRRRSCRLASKPACNQQAKCLFCQTWRRSGCGKGSLLARSATPTRCSKRLLEARTMEACPKDITSHPVEHMLTMEEVATNTQSMSQGLNLPIATLLSNPRTRKTGIPCSAKRGRFIEEDINDTGKSTANLCEILESNQTRGEHHQNADPLVEPDRVSIINQSLSGDCLALTDIASMAKKISPNECEDEIASSFNPPLVTVGNYRVKEEYASLLENIFDKHGDIAKDHTFESATMCSFSLEMVCVIILRLKGSRFMDINLGDLNSMMSELRDLNRSGLDVEWLRKRLDEIYEAREKLSESSSIKERLIRTEEAIEKMETDNALKEMIITTKEDEVQILHEKIEKLVKEIVIHKEIRSSIMADLAALKAEKEKIKADALDTRKKVDSFYKKSLLGDLL